MKDHNKRIEVLELRDEKAASRLRNEVEISMKESMNH